MRVEPMRTYLPATTTCGGQKAFEFIEEVRFDMKISVGTVWDLGSKQYKEKSSPADRQRLKRVAIAP